MTHRCSLHAAGQPLPFPGSNQTCERTNILQYTAETDILIIPVAKKSENIATLLIGTGCRLQNRLRPYTRRYAVTTCPFTLTRSIAAARIPAGAMIMRFFVSTRPVFFSSKMAFPPTVRDLNLLKQKLLYISLGYLPAQLFHRPSEADFYSCSW